MTDREKVIKALECAIQYGPHYCGGEFGDENEYSRIGQNILMDALALLKAQEPAKPVYGFGVSRCGNCKREIDKYGGDKYCPNCGRMVKWE